ncbi:MAG: hypothetical protein E7287_01795 [Lachnospiraceae bacterium]|nr:hypothetical protein [Lachnospiraceae bacterium]
MRVRKLITLILVCGFLLGGCSDTNVNRIEKNEILEKKQNSDEKEVELNKLTEVAFDIKQSDYNKPQYAIREKCYVFETEASIPEETFSDEVCIYNGNDRLLYKYYIGDMETEIYYDKHGKASWIYSEQATTRSYYDEGKLVKREHRSHVSEEIYCIEYWTYDSNNKLVKYEKYNSDDYNNIEELYTYEDNILVKKEIYIDCVLDEWEEYEYDADGNCELITRNYFINDEPRTSYVNYDYDENGNKVREVETYGVGRSVYREWEYYDDNGVKAFIQYKPDEGTSLISAIWNYDTNGNIIEVIEYSYEGVGTVIISEDRVTRVYDEENRKIEECVWYDEHFERGTKYEYTRLSEEEFKTIMNEVKEKSLIASAYILFDDISDIYREEALSKLSKENSGISNRRMREYIVNNWDFFNAWILYSASCDLESFGNVDVESEYAAYNIAALLQILLRMDGGEWNSHNEVPISEVEKLLTHYTKSNEYSIEKIKELIAGYEFIWYDEESDSVVFGGLYNKVQGDPDYQYEVLDSGNLKVIVNWLGYYDSDYVYFSQEFIFITERIPRLISYKLLEGND